jgi:NAD(P)-dependent dehydrogenase (short-subunit alcohol dehydrogenase family)
MKPSDGKFGSLEETAEAVSINSLICERVWIEFFYIRNRGGQCIPVCVDHEKSEEIKALFEQISKEQDGRLDILVNNAYKGAEVIKKAIF